MAVIAGSRLGAYEIVAAIGAGGMGEVFSAHDTKLNRTVALKILPAAFAKDPDRLARFQREAQVLASLNHPNIAAIYGLEDSTDITALVMELVPGPTLAEMLRAQGPGPLALGLPASLSIARQIGEALEAAHEQGIVHRDLKPANVKVADGGRVKLLDFGLAKALGPDAASGAAGSVEDSPTVTGHATKMGVILGTAVYMAPEQAKGRGVDKRADVWAFGVVLYEMLTGERLFNGEDASETLAAVLRQEIGLGALPASTPPRLTRLLERCLERDPRQRLRDIGEARIELERLERLESGSADRKMASGSTPAIPSPAIAPRWKRVLPWVSTSVLSGALFGVAVVAIWAPGRAPIAPMPMRFSMDAGTNSQLMGNLGPRAVISPDGRLLAMFAFHPAGSMLYVRRLDQLYATLLAGTENSHGSFFSPDGRWIGFFTASHLKKISVSGGAAVTIADVLNGRGATWADDGTIYFNAVGMAASLMRVPASGGVPEAVTSDNKELQRWPQVLPGGTALLYTSAGEGGAESANLVIQPLPSGPSKVVVRGAYAGRYVNSGHLVFMRQGSLAAAPFDLATLEVSGEARPVVDGVLGALSSGPQFSVSDAGTLVYSAGQGLGTSRQILWMDSTGATTPLRATETDWSTPRFSPDGERVALTVNAGGHADVWLYDWARDTPTRFTFETAHDTFPAWTPDGHRIVFSSNRGASPVNNLYWQRADGTGNIQRLTNSPLAHTAYSFDPTGKYLTYAETSPKTSTDLMILPIDGSEATGWTPGKPTVFLATPAIETSPMFSPDGKWIAYMSDESGLMQTYVRPFPGPGGNQLVSTGPGIYPVWSRVKDELFFLEPLAAKVMVAGYTVEAGALRPGKPRLWSPTSYLQTGTSRAFDLHPDGQRVAIGKPQDASGDGRDKLVVVTNFFEELRRVK